MSITCWRGPWLGSVRGALRVSMKALGWQVAMMIQRLLRAWLHVPLAGLQCEGWEQASAIW